MSCVCLFALFLINIYNNVVSKNLEFTVLLSYHMIYPFYCQKLALCFDIHEGSTRNKVLSTVVILVSINFHPHLYVRMGISGAIRHLRQSRALD